MAVKKTGESKAKKVAGGIAVALALILVGGVCGGLLQHHYNWGAEEKPPVEDSTGGEEKPGRGFDGRRRGKHGGGREPRDPPCGDEACIERV